MRTSLVAAAIVWSVIGVAAQQATPPTTSQPPTTSPPAATPPPSTSTPSTKPAAAQAPTTRPPAAKSMRAPAPAVSAPGGERPPTVGTPKQPAPPRADAPEIARPGMKEPATPGWTPNTPGGTWQNVRLDVKIFDTVDPDASGKIVTFVCMDGQNGQVRAQAGEGLIKIDAKPTVRSDGRIWVQLTIEYQPDVMTQQTQQGGASRVAGFSETLSVVVTDGKPMVASQSAQPKGDRKVSVEVTATLQPIK